MNAPRPRWWQRKRIVVPLASLVLIVAALVVALVRSGISQIMVYNESGAPLGPLQVKVCGQTVDLARMDDEGSVRIRLRASGEASSVQLSLPGDPSWHWEGEYVEPRGGYLVFIHVRPGREVDASTQISFWQRWLFGRGER